MKQKIKAMLSKLKQPAVLQRAGMGLVCAGALLLAASYMLSWTNVNALLLLYLFMIAAGIILHVYALKSESRY